MYYSLWYNVPTMWVHYTTCCNTQSSAPEDVYIIYISLYIFFRLAKQSQFIPLQNVVYLITLPFLVRKIFTFYINVVLLFKYPFPGPKG